MSEALQRLDASAHPDDIVAAVERDGAVIVESLLAPEVVDRVNEEVGATLDAVDPDEELFNDVMKAFHGPFTKQLAGAPGLSRTFAVDVMCNPLLLAICDRVLLPSCARYQLNLGHLLQRGPGSDEQLLHRDELVWSDMPRPGPELQLATVIAFVDFTRENGATSSPRGSAWPATLITNVAANSPQPQAAAAMRRRLMPVTRRARRMNAQAV